MCQSGCYRNIDCSLLEDIAPLVEKTAPTDVGPVTGESQASAYRSWILGSRLQPLSSETVLLSGSGVGLCFGAKGGLSGGVNALAGDCCWTYGRFVGDCRGRGFEFVGEAVLIGLATGYDALGEE